MIKKITFKFRSGFITPLESDTILGYVFAKNFDELKTIFEKFEGGNIPFTFSNGFESGWISRPCFFDKKGINNYTLQESLKNEETKKKVKKMGMMPITIDNFKAVFEDNKIGEILAELETYQGEIIDVDHKNTIPRFENNETGPYAIDNIKYNNNPYTIYVNIFDEESFQLFYNAMEKTFLSIGWGKLISKGYGKISEIKLENINKEETAVFEYIEKLEQNNIHLILNNYKPSKEEIEIFDTNNSYLNIINKNTKSGEDNTFKGNMKFIGQGSIIRLENQEIGLKGSYYKVGNSFNFGYIF